MNIQDETRKAALRPDQVAVIDRALASGSFSQADAQRLADGLKGQPAQGKLAAEHLQASLACEATAIPDADLARLANAVGADFQNLYALRQHQSGPLGHEVGPARVDKTVADAHDPAKHKAASDARLQAQKAILEGARGVITGQTSAKEAAADTATTLARDLASRAEATWDGRLGDGGRAAKDVLREPLIRTATDIAHELLRSPETRASMGALASAVGTAGFRSALGEAATSIGHDVVTATRMTQVDVGAVHAAVAATSGAAARLTALAGDVANPELAAAVEQHAGSLAAGVARLGAKLTSLGGGAASAAQTAAAAEGVATGAHVATAGTRAAGQSVPVVGQALGVMTTSMAAVELVACCRHEPRDWKRVAAAGANVVGQAAGIFVPFVGAASTVGKLAVDAALHAQSEKEGRLANSLPSPPGGVRSPLGIDDVAPSLATVTELARPFLEGAGHDDAARKLQSYSQQVTLLASQGLSATELSRLSAVERDALTSQLAACTGEAERLVDQSQGTPHEPAARLLGEAFRGLLGVYRKSKQADGPAAEGKLAGEAMEAVGKAAVASAVVDAASIADRSGDAP